MAKDEITEYEENHRWYIHYLPSFYCNLEIYTTRLLGRFAPIFYLNCKHVIFAYILKQGGKKFCGFLKKNSWIFKNLNFSTKLKTFKTYFKKNFIIHKPSLWSRDLPQKIWARSVQPFRRLLDTNRQTNTKTSQIYI